MPDDDGQGNVNDTGPTSPFVTSMSAVFVVVPTVTAIVYAPVGISGSGVNVSGRPLANVARAAAPVVSV